MQNFWMHISSFLFLALQIYHYVMRSREINLNLNKRRRCDIFCFLFDWSAHLESYILLKTSPESDQYSSKVMSNWMILKTTEKKAKERKKFIPLTGLYISQSMLLTDFARSSHIFRINQLQSFRYLFLSVNFMWILVNIEVFQFQ